jgi:hypothetical protein
MTTLEKIQRFERYLELTHGSADQTLDLVFDKLLERKRAELVQQRDAMRAELDAFERQYQLASAEFFDKFRHGELGDATDFFDWSATWQMYRSTLQYLNVLSIESDIQRS